MKNIAIVLLLAVSIALGALTLRQRNQLSETRTQLVAVETRLQAQAATIESAKAAANRAKMLEAALKESAAAAGEQSKQQTKEVTQLQTKLAAAKTNAPANGLSALSTMFKDPKMKEMIKTQQKAVMGPMIEKQYAGLFRQLNLTPEDSASMKDLLMKKTLAGADAGMSLLDGSMGTAQRAELAKQMKAETDAYNAQIKDFLGADNYSAFQNYEKTVPDRMAVSQFNDQLGGGPNPLSADQQEQLTRAMNVARTSYKWTTDYSNKTPGDGDYAALFSEDKINQYAQEKEQFDQQFLAKAQQILTPDQIKAFADFQKNQRDMQMMGMKMAANMFAPKGQ
ncbi:MAG: hypothetical protein WCH99_21490 [Verrucomicrobiota bacterium]